MSVNAEPGRPPTPWVIWLIVGAIAAAYVAFINLAPRLQNEIDYAFALIPLRFHPQSPDHFAHWYDALGPMFGHVFLHVAWWHAALNAFFIFATGRYPASILGPWRFLALFFISAIGGALAFIALNWGEQGIAVGASGALCGVFSAYFLSARPSWRQSLADPLVRNQFMMIFGLNVVAMAVAAEAFDIPIAWEGHLGGFVAGALAWVALAPRGRGGV